MSLVFQNIDPPPPSPPGECVYPRLCCGGTHSPGGEGVGGSIFWKTQDTALYSTYIESSLAVGIDRIAPKGQNDRRKPILPILSRVKKAKNAAYRLWSDEDAKKTTHEKKNAKKLPIAFGRGKNTKKATHRNRNAKTLPIVFGSH